MYIIYALLYALIIGFHGVLKKQARVKSNTSTVLVMFTTVTFLLSLMWIPFGVAIPLNYIWIFVLKGFLLTFSWFIILKVLKDADVSVVTALQLISVVFTFTIGILVFNESVNFVEIIGIVIILTCIVLMSFVNRKEKNGLKPIHFVFILIAALITTSSNVIDKYTTNTLGLTNFQVQFWFLLFTFVFSWIFFYIDCFRSKEFLIKKQDLSNYWIYLVGLTLFFGDFFLFLSYTTAGSQMIIITIISKLKVIITTIAGILIFKEKNVWIKILLTSFLVAGTLLISLF